MPVYLFTYHSKGSWLPDRKQGYVRRGAGIQSSDPHMHRLYHEAMKGDPIAFAIEHQRAIIDSVVESQGKQKFEAYCVATESTHAHVLISWTDERSAVKMRALVKGSLSRALNKRFINQVWLAEGGSRKRVRDRKHFNYLVDAYLPKHSGWKWSRSRGFFV